MGAIYDVRVDLSGLKARELLIETGAMDKTMDFLLDRTRDKVPVYDGWAGATGHAPGTLRENGRVLKIDETFEAVTYDVIYASKQELRDWQKHPSGGQSHYVSDTWDLDMDDALDLLIDVLTSGG